MTAPRFLCDAMLGHVTRWLRLAGFDAEYATSEATDEEILQRTRDDPRVLLTRDVKLQRRAEAQGTTALLLDARGAPQALAAVLHGLGLALDDAKFFTRCTRCNAPLRPASRDEVAPLVPPLVLERQPTFHRCTQCGQVYWEGTHVGAIRDELQRLHAGDADK